jgi:hypothetical protein
MKFLFRRRDKERQIHDKIMSETFSNLIQRNEEKDSPYIIAIYLLQAIKTYFVSFIKSLE